MDRGITTTEAAKRLSVHRETVYLMLQSGKLRGSQIKAKWRVSENSIEQFLSGGPTPEPVAEKRRREPAEFPAVVLRYGKTQASA